MCDSFEKGVLYIRVFNGEVDELFYTNEDVPYGYTGFEARGIASISLGRGRHFRQVTWNTAHNGKVTPDGNVIGFRKATDSDIGEFFGCWVGTLTPRMWAIEVEKITPNLRKEEKARIKRIADSYR